MCTLFFFKVQTTTGVPSSFQSLPLLSCIVLAAALLIALIINIVLCGLSKKRQGWFGFIQRVVFCNCLDLIITMH